MKVRKANLDDIGAIRKVALNWKAICNSKEFGIEIDDEIYLDGVRELIRNDDKDVLLLTRDNQIIGYMGIEIFNSPLGNQKIANEHYLFMSEPSASVLLLLRKAKEWAREKGCSHLILNASNLASGLHDKVCKFYEHINMKKFETSYIEDLKGE